MKNIFLSLLFLPFLVFGQDYFQQEVNYTISVRLDDERHFLHGFETIEYHNNSPEALEFIYFHLWPNAYNDGNSALAEQLYQDNNDILKFVTEENRGYIDSLDFKVNEQSLVWEFDPHHKDIAKITLPSPLKPGEEITLSTPFRIKLPSGNISRLGHIGQSYQITQWYPKPAVFDKNGWHQMPYLNQGEFYSEFGSFDVSITLPQNYVVGATGDLQTASERTFLDSLSQSTYLKYEMDVDFSQLDKNIPSSQQTKTIRFTQQNVHDFAWFADKRFQLLTGELILPHGQEKVDLYALFTPQNAKQWKRSVEYLHDGGYYYSLWNGDYPYKQITAVDGTISAGGGMEYPNVTVIGNTSSDMELEVVIVHEVGHNWFYGILGTNERAHGWMDEGLNTLNEVRYIETKYAQNTYLSNMLLNGKFNFHGLGYRDMNDLLVRSWMSLGEDQPIQTHSANFTGVNYGLTMYQKTGLVFDYAKYYLGEEAFDQAMQHYFETWKFKHPQPSDLKKTLEESTGKKLDWLFDELIHTTWQLDYKVGCTKHRQGKTKTKIKNVGQVDGPIPVTAVRDSTEVTQWIEPGSTSTTLTFDFPAEAVQIDSKNQLPEINRQNNQWKKSQLFPRYEPWRVGFLTSYNRKNQTNINLLPAMAYNRADQFMIGALVHNISPAFHPFQYFVAPMYSFGRNGVSGIAELSYTLRPKNKIKSMKYGVSLKSFSTNTIFEQEIKTFAIASPFVQALWYNEQKRQPWRHTLHAQGMMQQSDRFVSDQEFGGFAYYRSDFKNRDHEVRFIARQDFIHNTRNDDQMSRLTAEAKYRYRYKKKGESKWIEARWFGGYNLLYNVSPLAGNNYRYRMSASGQDGKQDIFVEEYFFDRNSSAGIFHNQRVENMGGFLSTSIFGTTNSWLTTANFYMEMPLPFLGIFADVGAVDLSGTVYGLYNAGIGARIGNIFGIYFPFIQSENLLDGIGSNAYAERIRISLKLNFVNSGGLSRLIQ